MGYPSVKAETCPVKKSLTDELLNAHSHLAELDDRDVQCILRGDLAGSAALNDQLLEARLRRERALEAIHRHIAEHACH